jgi:hypothetical protein
MCCRIAVTTASIPPQLAALTFVVSYKSVSTDEIMKEIRSRWHRTVHRQITQRATRCFLHACVADVLMHPRHDRLNSAAARDLDLVVSCVTFIDQYPPDQLCNTWYIAPFTVRFPSAPHACSCASALPMCCFIETKTPSARSLDHVVN